MPPQWAREHVEWMRQALIEGRKALPACLPNPPVGCVIVSNGHRLAHGHTGPPGHPHAEAMALSGLAVPATGMTAYVTLEPCSFTGRTPSCARALVGAAIGRVFVGIVDPHPRNQGKGIEILRASGIEVEVGLLAQDIEAAVSPYLVR